MKWIKEKDKELGKLILQGKNHYEIAEVFGITKKSVSNRCFRLKLKVIYYKEYSCKNCNKKFSDLIKRSREFCSKSCAGTFNSLGRVHSDETKQKIRIKISGHTKSEEAIRKVSGKNHPNWIDGRAKKRQVKKVDGKKKCRYCNKFNVSKKHKLICDDCRMEYYEAYRPACEFKFDVNDFKEEFNFTLIEQYGWYSPSNKGNNLDGVSRDHSYSVRDGFINKVYPEIIAHPTNCRLMKHSDNNLKNYDSSITLEELKEKIKKWNKKYNY